MGGGCGLEHCTEEDLPLLFCHAVLALEALGKVLDGLLARVNSLNRRLLSNRELESLLGICLWSLGLGLLEKIFLLLKAHLMFEVASRLRALFLLEGLDVHVEGGDGLLEELALVALLEPLLLLQAL